MPFIRKHNLIQRGERVAVAVSGGGDSMALLHLLLHLRDELQISVLAANVEHGIRGDTSLRDTRFVVDFCECEGIECVVERVNAVEFARAQKMTVEQAARNLRYAFFNRLISTGRCDKVATAHNLNDSAESVLMHLFRGAGISGACGIAPQNGAVIRPLLACERREIDGYLHENHVEYMHDETNDDTLYTRNFVRHKILQPAAERYVGVEQRIAAFAECARQDHVFLSELAKEYLSESQGGVLIADACFTTPALYSRAIVAACARLGQSADIERVHINAVAELTRGKVGRIICLPGGVFAVRDCGGVTIYKNQTEHAAVVPFAVGEISISGRTVMVERGVYRAPEKGVLQLKLTDEVEGAVFRQINIGDEFIPFGGVSKKLNKYLSDKKIPARLRSALIVLASGKKILAIVGVEISAGVAATEGETTVRIKWKEI